jgi:hypothetical protein
MLYQLSYSREKSVGGAGFEPTKAKPAGLQPAPFDHSGIPPQGVRKRELAENVSSVKDHLVLTMGLEPATC